MLNKVTLDGEQKKVLFLSPNDPVLIKGVAGSGKTTVALYRAKHIMATQVNLFEKPNIAIFTYNRTLANYLDGLLPYVNDGYQIDSEQIKPKTDDGLNATVTNFHRWAYQFAEIKPNATISGPSQLEIIENIKNSLFSPFSNILNKSADFFKEEISWIKGRLINSKETYLNTARDGRGISDRVTAVDKEVIWEVYSKYNIELQKNNKVDFDDYAIFCLHIINNNPYWEPPFTHVIIDEAQDLSKAQMIVITKLVSQVTQNITIIADAAQKIYKSGFTWKDLGLDLRGNKTIVLKKNYRNPEYIARAAHSLLQKEKDKSDFTDIVINVTHGEKPVVGYFDDLYQQLNYLKVELQKHKSTKNIASTIILHRNHRGVNEISTFLNNNGFQTEILKTNAPVNYNNESVKICTMHSIKGLEFDYVFIMDLKEGIIPSYNELTEGECDISVERRLLYTCMTRAKIGLYLLGDKNNPSSFLAEIDSNLLNVITDSRDDDNIVFKDIPF